MLHTEYLHGGNYSVVNNLWNSELRKKQYCNKNNSWITWIPSRLNLEEQQMESLRSHRYWCLYSSSDVVGREREAGGSLYLLSLLGTRHHAKWWECVISFNSKNNTYINSLTSSSRTHSVNKWELLRKVKQDIQVPLPKDKLHQDWRRC